MTTLEDERAAAAAGAGPIARRPGRRLARAAAGVVLMAAAAAGGWAWNGSSTRAPAPAGAAPATAVVERGTLTDTSRWAATLAAGRLSTIASAAQGTVTRLAEPGATVQSGDVLYRLDEQPVVLLSGAVPMYRDLRPGDTGADAEQLRANLESLGYEGFTDRAVRAWQADLGAAVSGTVSRAGVVFVPEARQIDSLRVAVGDRVAPGSPVLDITGVDQVVNLQVDLDDRDRLEVGTEVSVGLPGGGEVPGTVSAATVTAGSTTGGDAEPEPVVQVEVTLAEQVSEDLVGAAVEVVVGTGTREDVLFVPVTALLALAEGGYGLEVVEDTGPASVVPVTTGLFAGGKVEITGDGIAEGTVVGVAGR